jgi:microcystin-dependent protein
MKSPVKSYQLILIIFWLAGTNHIVTAQDAGVGIGTATPDQSAVLHINAPSANKGVLVPRLTSQQRRSISSPAQGLIVYDTDAGNLYFFEGHWQMVGTPKGGIIMWSGSTPPPGWVLCDGNYYKKDFGTATTASDPVGVLTPNLSGQFIVGYNPGDADYNAIGKQNGEKLHTLTQGEMPSHNHDITVDYAGTHNHGYDYPNSKTVGKNSGGGESAADHGAYTNYSTSDAGDHMHSATAGYRGGNQPFENRPPYYVLAYIMKL